MTESDQAQDSTPLVQVSKSASPSNYWGRGSFGSQTATTSPESPEEISSEAPAEIPLLTQPESKRS